MAEKKLRVIIDTNLWISFLISNDYTKFDELIFSGSCTLVFSEELIAEFLSVAKRPKFRRYFGPEEIEELLEIISEYADFVDVTTQVDICRDPKDNFLLSLATDGNADFLITGDKDLLDLDQVANAKITTISAFLSI